MIERVPSADISDLKTWVKFKPSYCSHCVGTCCSLPTEVTFNDLVRMGEADAFEASEDPKKIAKRLMKSGVLEHFNGKTELFTLARLSNNDCIYLHQKLRHCIIYEKRPDTCRNHPHTGPKPGFCAYQQK